MVRSGEMKKLASIEPFFVTVRPGGRRRAHASAAEVCATACRVRDAAHALLRWRAAAAVLMWCAARAQRLLFAALERWRAW